MIQINLERIAKMRGVTNIYTFLVDGGITAKTATIWASGKCKNIKLDTLEHVCNLFNCEVYDIMEWVPDASVANVTGSPLRVMLPKPNEVEITRLMKQLPLEKLKELLKEARRIEGTEN
jgi:DNA-binding Xre family transcriptional regulator